MEERLGGGHVDPAQQLSLIDPEGRPGGGVDAAEPTLLAALSDLRPLPPNTPANQTAAEVKMASKAAGSDYAVSKLEGVWWKEGVSVEWTWQLLIRVPEFITKKHLSDAVTKLMERDKDEVVARVTLETLDEGKCVQVLHIGPYTAEQTTIAKMRAFAKQQGLSFRGRHHEIYLSDPRRVGEEKLRTILRQPVG